MQDKKLHSHTSLHYHNIIMSTMLLFALAFVIAGLFTGDIADLPKGLWRIFTCPAPLVTDFTMVGGLNAALFNAGMCGLFVFVLYKCSGFVASGGAFGAYFLAVGIGLFGKTIFTIIPFVLGGMIYAWYKKEPFRRIILYPIQASALSPIVTILTFSNGFSWGGAALGYLSAMMIGFVITPVAIHTRSMHRGFDLYNVGLAAGLIGIIFFAIYREVALVPYGFDNGYHITSLLGDSRPDFFFPFLGSIFALISMSGLLMSKEGIKEFWALRDHTGLDIDFAPEFGVPAVLMNMGFVGLMALFYMILIGAPMNGVTVGALLSVLCWTGNGANTRNMLPIFVGYGLYSLVTGMPLNSQYLCVAVCYATGLAPLAGRYGNIYGVIVGAIHAFIAGITTNMHGGFNLYNGGFSAGLVSLVMVPIIQSIARHEYHDDASHHEKHPGLVEELAVDVVHIAEGAAHGVAHIAEEAVHLVEHDKSIVQELPEDHRESKTVHTFLLVRNIFAGLAAIVFILSILPIHAFEHYSHLFKFVAYILGAGAYGAEIIVLTDGLRKNPGAHEMMMPYIFGLLYIMLGFSYLGGH
ncbi:MAG: DUF1576 domain-containing protein [Clostridia bacterium]|nr:DUF1576 domain-containing protein [Clostridia bacterium]